jgi:replicative DNA helicase
MSSSEPKSLEMKILQFTLHREFYGEVSHILSEDMFEGLAKTIYRTIVDCHEVGEYNLTTAEVHSQLLTANPALTQNTRDEIAEMFETMSDPPANINIDLQSKIVHEFWVRDQARIIGEKAIDIYTGTDLDFTDIKEAVQRVTEHTTSSSETYTIYDVDFLELIDQEEKGCDFPFELDLIKQNVEGTSRGNLGIIFARPEVGKTTFCASLAASYIRQGMQVVYWANEEPASKIKIRIIQSYLRATKEEMISGKVSFSDVYHEKIKPYLTIISAVGTSIEEVERFCRLRRPDVVFADQLDKFRINGEFNRGDERLKQTYITAREIAKRCDLMFWAVSQANYDAHNRMNIDYSMLDNSRTGKAGEADIIIGIGKTGSENEDNYMRFLCISKNKINGWHGTINTHIDIHRGYYY